MDFNKKVTGIIGSVNETFSSIGQIRIYRLEDRFIKKFKNKSQEACKNLYDLTLSEDLVEVVNQFSATLIEVGLYVLGVLLILRNELSINALLSLVVTSTTVTHPIYAFSRTAAKFSKTKKLMEKIMDIINEDKDEEEKRYKINDIQDIRLNNYQGRYGDNPVNKKLDFAINRSDKILIQGQNGAGKSTLIDSIIGFNSNYLGDILYNNKDLRLIDLESLWERISYVSQKTLVFEQSIRNNIILDKDFDNDKYTKIIKNLGLDRLDDGLIVNEIQNNLSGGEIQKILIGRSLYKDSDLVIMDEPFSALDSASINRLVSTIMEDERTYIIIAHNLNLEIRDHFDKVVEIAKI